MLVVATFCILSLKVIQAFYSESPVIHNLNEDNFEHLVNNSKYVWIVEYFAEWCVHCERFAPEFIRAAEVLKGLVNFGAIDSSKNKEIIKKHSVLGFPTIVLHNGEGTTPERYEGSRTTPNLVQHALDKINKRVRAKLESVNKVSMFKDLNTVVLTDENFEEFVVKSKETWLVVFYSPYCYHCMLLASEWSEILDKLAQHCKIGSLDATMHPSTASNYHVHSYPSILFFQESENKTIVYDLDLSADSIVQWTKEKLSDFSPDPEVRQIVNVETLKQSCKNAPLCLVVFFPDILSCQAACRNEYLNIVMALAAKYKRNLWGWVWSEAGAQAEMEKSLDVGGSGFPTLVAVSVKKMMYSRFVGAFSFDGINEFLRNLSFGKGDAAPLKVNLMHSVVTISPWDGLDKQDPTMEEILNLKSEL